MLRIFERIKAEARRSAQNGERTETGERGDEVVGQPFAPGLILERSVKRQDSEAETAAGFRIRFRFAKSNPRHLHRLADALQRLRADSFDRKIRRGFKSIENLVREANTARIGEALKSRGDVDRLSQQILAVGIDMSQMDADPVGQRLGAARLTFGQRPLNRDCALYGASGSRKFRQHAVTAGREDSAPVGGDRSIDDRPTRRQRRQGATLVKAHRPRIVRRVSRKNGGRTSRRQTHGGSDACHTPSCWRCSRRWRGISL